METQAQGGRGGRGGKGNGVEGISRDTVMTLDFTIATARVSNDTRVPVEPHEIQH